MDFTQFTAISGDQSKNESILGQLLYMTLGSTIVLRDTMADIFTDLNLPKKLLTNRSSHIDAFLSATGDISTKITTPDNRMIKLYVRDNSKEKGDKIYSRELVKEVVGSENRYIKLGNFRYDKENEVLSHEVVGCDSDVSSNLLNGLVEKVEKLFDLYKKSYNRNSVETIFDNLLNTMDVSKVSTYGKLFFVPRYKMDKIVALEELADRINQANMLKTLDMYFSPITVNAIYVINDEKQRKNFEQDFYNTVEREIEDYQRRLQHFLENGKASEKIIGKYLEKIQQLYRKKKCYEEVFKKSLNKLNEQFEGIEVLAHELMLRAKNGQAARRSARLDTQIELFEKAS